MDPQDDEQKALRSVALGNARSILLARRRAEQALERRTQELTHSLSTIRATLESTADAILVTSDDGRIVTFNERFLGVLMVSREQLAASTQTDLLHRLAAMVVDPARFLSRRQEIISQPETEALDEVAFTDGRIFERFTRPQVMEGQIVVRVWSFRDITVRKRAEASLVEEAAVLDLLSRTGAEIASTLELPTLLQRITDAATQLSGAEFGAFFYNTTDAAGDVYMLYTLSGAAREDFERFGQPRATPMFGQTFNGGPPVRCDDVMADPRYGQWGPHFGMPKGHLPVRSYLAVPVISRGGETLGGLFFGHSKTAVFSERSQRLVVGIASQASVAIDNARLYEGARQVAIDRERLVDAERAARENIARVSQLKDEFLATLSHELRTPLTAILGWAKLLLRKADPETLARGLDAIDRNATAQARLIDDLLDMNRIISGKVRLDVQPIDLAGIVDVAVDAIRPSAEAKQLRLRKVIDPHAAPVSGDPNRLQQIFWNLLTNAVKFTPKGGAVDVVLQRVNSHLEVLVSDTGVGIAAEFLPQVFDRFRQADSSVSRSLGGLGLGLSIVKQLVELHGGTVAARSDGEGCGAVFVVSLPLAPLRSAAGRVHPSATLPTGPELAINLDLDGLAVLVVDDEPDARDLICELLRERRAEVHVAASAAEALQQIERHLPAVLVSDIGMPGHDGYHLIREVRRLPPERGGRTPAIALTAFARSEDRTRAMLSGYQVHVSKPIEAQELIATIASLSGRTQQRDGEPPAGLHQVPAG